MENPLYKLMITNIKEYLKNVDVNDEEAINAFRFSETLAIATGKLKEDVLMDIVENIKDKYSGGFVVKPEKVELIQEYGKIQRHVNLNCYVNEFEFVDILYREFEHIRQTPQLVSELKKIYLKNGRLKLELFEPKLLTSGSKTVLSQKFKIKDKEYSIDFSTDTYRGVPDLVVKKNVLLMVMEEIGKLKL